MMTSFSERLSLKLRKQISNKLNGLSLSYFDGHKPGEILSKATNDLDKMSETIQTGLLNLFTAIGTIVGSIIMMMYYNVGFTLIFIVFMAISMTLTKIFTNKTIKYALNRQEKIEKLTAQVEEAYSGRIIIQSFNKEDESIERMKQITDEVAKATRNTDFITYAINPAIRFINRLSQVVIAILAGKALIDGRLTVGGFQAFFVYLNQAAEPLTEASYMINSLQSALASVERIYEMLDEEEISKDPQNLEEVSNAEGNVEFVNVKFGYSKNKMLMENINFKVKKGQKVAIVGNTGAGKTTLINLLMRFYDVNGGKILLDGKDTKNLTRANLRSNFGMVLQDTWLFEGTVAENIAYGKPDATRKEIEIGKAMETLMQNRTSFIIAHRLSTIVDADIILVMKDGTIIEQGNHKELLEKNGAYAELYNSQFA